MPSEGTSSLSTRDIVTLVLSSLALIVSFVSAWYSAKRQQASADREFRGRLTDVALKLIDSTLKIRKLDGIANRDRSADELNERGIELQRLAALARQADRLITKDTEKLATDVDYLTLAQAFSMDGDTLLAEHYWERTLSASQRPFDLATNKTNYAWYLFTTNRPTDARRQYEGAINDSVTSRKRQEDSRYVDVGWFYEGWMRMEVQFGFFDEAATVREKARETYARIGSEPDRSWRIAQLDESFARLVAGSASAVSGPAPDAAPMPR